MPLQSPRLLPPGFVPPYLLDRLAERAGAHASARAAQTLMIDREHRGLREAAATQGVSSGRPPAYVRRDSPQRAVHDAEHTMSLPGKLVRAEGQAPTNDIAADEAYDYLGATYRLYRDIYERDSIDGAGMPLTGSVHYGNDYDNAFWNGKQMVFGDGDGEVMNRFTIAVDIIGHELTHGVIDHESGLVYQGQSGALNESICDVFGVLVKQHLLKQTAQQSDWLIGAGLFTAKVAARALRSMAEPGTAYDDPVLGKDPQPAHMKDLVVTRQDNGGVHINSGIPNRAFYLAATAIQGPAWETAGRVWYDTVCDRRLRPDADFLAFAQLSAENAAKRFGAGSAAHKAIGAAWNTAGVTPS
ncbi:M4 family metallopeptidase [Variovorax paradoxus]|uniref:M4 family metallopeptidase n=1 Tax=Variovorax paradoxus TaxID=34073 RepID=UPI002481666B|nr:M4 family metallopeptidase [Variovorax paradoxus]WGT63861.1 M4 family metallopeptidase [Variovorax paradoxus]